MISTHALKKVARYYSTSLESKQLLFVFVSFLGFLRRLVSIANFALMIKIFLTMFNPNASVALINEFLVKLQQPTISAENLTTYLILILLTSILLQFTLNKVNLILFLRLRRAVISRLSQTSNATLGQNHLSFIYDHYIHGFEALVRSFEILIFYAFLLIFIFTVNTTIGLAVIILVPILVGLLVFKNRKEAFVQTAIRQARKHSAISDTDHLLPLMMYDRQLKYRVNNEISADVLGGLTITFIFYLYSLNQSQFSSYGVVALLLVFSIRFAVLYAGELSRQLNVALKLRTALD